MQMFNKKRKKNSTKKRKKEGRRDGKSAREKHLCAVQKKMLFYDE